MSPATHQKSSDVGQEELLKNGRSPESQADRQPASSAIVILAWLAVFATMYFARDLLIPIALSLLLTFLLMPLLRNLRAWRVPDIVSAFALVTVVVVLFTIAVFTLAGEAQRWLADSPRVLTRVSRLIPTESGPFKHLQVVSKRVQEMTRGYEEKPVTVEVASHDTMVTALGVSTQFVGVAVIVFVLTFFFLSFNSTLLKQAVESRHSYHEKRNIVELVHNVENGVSRYLFTITVINIGLGFVAGSLLWLMGLPNPMLWGVMVATLNYVPHVGAFLCMAILFLVGAVTHESLSWGLATAGMFAVLTSLESYLITPLVLSRSLRLSPLAIILSILFWGWMWGAAGALMAAPLLAVIKITCDQFPTLSGLSAFLAGETSKPDAAPE